MRPRFRHARHDEDRRCRSSYLVRNETGIDSVNTPIEKKSSTEEIRQRFDGDVERFSSLETGQVATVDARLAMDLITVAAANTTNPIRRILDVGCGAGNNSIALLNQIGSDVEVDLLDLSRPMLDRAAERVGELEVRRIRTKCSDFRTASLASGSYDVVLAAAVLHHLRDEDDWERAFEKIYDVLRREGSVWITDLVSHESEAVQALMWKRYGEYLFSINGDEYREKVFSYIDKEDSPRPVSYQLDLLRRVGFSRVDLLHKNSCFAAFGAIK